MKSRPSSTFPPPIHVAVPRARLAVWDLGRGVPTVFVHGGTGTAHHDWGHLVPALVDGARMILVDLRGHGRSPDPTLAIGIGRFDVDLLHVMTRLGCDRAVLVGFSAGAGTVLHLASRQPERALAVVTVGASVKGDPDRVEAIMSGPWPSVLRDLDHDGARDDPEYWKRLRAALARDWADNVDFPEQRLRAIACPVTVIHGAVDAIVPASQADLLGAALPSATVVKVPGAGHQVQGDAPEAVVDILRDVISAARR